MDRLKEKIIKYMATVETVDDSLGEQDGESKFRALGLKQCSPSRVLWNKRR